MKKSYWPCFECDRQGLCNHLSTLFSIQTFSMLFPRWIVEINPTDVGSVPSGASGYFLVGCNRACFPKCQTIAVSNIFKHKYPTRSVQSPRQSHLFAFWYNGSSSFQVCFFSVKTKKKKDLWRCDIMSTTQ